MTDATLEHANITVTDIDKTALMLCDLFDWHIRWKGEALNKGTTIHVGSDTSYLAIYTPLKVNPDSIARNVTIGGLNHLGIVVDDLDATEQRVIKAGFKPHMHADYEPGRRFYFMGDDQIEYEVISYA